MLVWLAWRGMAGSRRVFVLLVAAVALGAGFQISNDANLVGFETELLDDAIAHGEGDIQVAPRDRMRFEDGDATATGFATQTGAIAVPILSYAGGVAGSDAQFRPATIHGVDAAAPRLPFRIIEGGPLRAGETDVMLGTALAARLGVAIGDRVELRVLLGPRDPVLGESNVLALSGTVRGIVVGVTGGYRAAFVDRARLAAAAGVPRGASRIALHLDDHHAARAIAARLASPELEVRTWHDDRGLTSYLEARDAIGGISYAMVIAAIAIPIWALLYIHVLWRQRELAILAALGFRRRELFAICTLQSVLTAVIGCAIGVVLGYALTRYFAANPVFEWHGLAIRPAITPATFAVPFAIIVATSVLAALHPAARAARVAPAVVLRRIE